MYFADNGAQTNANKHEQARANKWARTKAKQAWTKPNKHQWAQAWTDGGTSAVRMRASAWTGCPNEWRDPHSRDKGRGGVAVGAMNGSTSAQSVAQSTLVHVQELSKWMAGCTNGAWMGCPNEQQDHRRDRGRSGVGVAAGGMVMVMWVAAAAATTVLQ